MRQQAYWFLPSLDVFNAKRDVAVLAWQTDQPPTSLAERLAGLLAVDDQLQGVRVKNAHMALLDFDNAVFDEL